jgi:hypothetical protein
MDDQNLMEGNRLTLAEGWHYAFRDYYGDMKQEDAGIRMYLRRGTDGERGWFDNIDEMFAGLSKAIMPGLTLDIRYIFEDYMTPEDRLFLVRKYFRPINLFACMATAVSTTMMQKIIEVAPTQKGQVSDDVRGLLSIGSVLMESLSQADRDRFEKHQFYIIEVVDIDDPVVQDAVGDTGMGIAGLMKDMLQGKEVNQDAKVSVPALPQEVKDHVVVTSK